MDSSTAPQNALPRISQTWRNYLACHGRVSRIFAKIGLAGGQFHDLGRALLRMQNKRLYRAQHESFADYLAGQWQISTELARELITLYQVHSKAEMQAAGVLPVGVLHPLCEKLPAEARPAALRVLAPKTG